MKIDRLIGILSVLLQNDRTTAPALAERFEVSRRTINRDIEDLCMAGIPIETTQGAGGGIRIADGYRMDRTVLTSREMQMILAGLRSMDSVSRTNCCGQLMEKLQAGSSSYVSGSNSVLIDLSSWYRKSLTPKIETLQSAIERRHLVTFAYIGPGSESERTIEPYYILFRWSSWYVWGWCLLRQDFRLFKLNRMNRVTETQEAFAGRNAPLPDLEAETVFPAVMSVTALFSPEVKWRLVEEYGPDCCSEASDGRLHFAMDFTNPDNCLSWLLSFGDRVEVLSPPELRERIATAADNLRNIYGRKEPHEIPLD